MSKLYAFYKKAHFKYNDISRLEVKGLKENTELFIAIYL